MRLALVCVLFLSACAARAEVAFTPGTVEHQARARAYLLFSPPKDGAKKRPLVVALHGGGGKAAKLDRATNHQLSREAQRRGWVLVLPQGVEDGWNDGRKLTARRDVLRANVDDLGFLTRLIDKLVVEEQVDPRRVFMTGISNGGFMTMHFALERSAKIAAAGVVTAQMGAVHDGKRPSRPVAMLLMNGTADPIIPYAGGQVTLFGKSRGVILSTDETALRWLGFNGCAGHGEERALPDFAKNDGTRVFLTEGRGCQAPVARYRVRGGGHTWPGGRQYLGVKLIGRVSRDINGARKIFDFFDAQPR